MAENVGSRCTCGTSGVPGEWFGSHSRSQPTRMNFMETFLLWKQETYNLRKSFLTHLLSQAPFQKGTLKCSLPRKQVCDNKHLCDWLIASVHLMSISKNPVGIPIYNRSQWLARITKRKVLRLCCFPSHALSASCRTTRVNHAGCSSSCRNTWQNHDLCHALGGHAGKCLR